MDSYQKTTQKTPGIAVVMPALNEEMNVGDAIHETLQAFDAFGLDGEIIVVNDGSTDKTGDVIKMFMAKDPRVRTLRHEVPHGIGASFWDGVDFASKESVVMLPGDNENDPSECFRYLELLKDVDIIVPFVFNREARSSIRKLISYAYQFVINLSFGASFNYTNGTVIYRRCVLTELKNRSKGFFFQTDILIRTTKMKGYLFAEVPCRVLQRTSGRSKALSLKTFRRISADYLRLFWMYHFNRSLYNGTQYAKGTMTALRRG